MKVIIETDLGRDPDDLFAILYLVSAGAEIQCITLSPGDPDQVAIARFLCKQLNRDIPIGVGKPARNKRSSNVFHYALLDRYNHPLEAKPDGLGSHLINEVMQKNPETQLFAIGPLSSVGKYLREDCERSFSRCVMQGGFIGYDLHGREVRRLDKFENLETFPTFNINGDLKGVDALLKSKTPRSFVGKNVCHTVIYDRMAHDQFNDCIRHKNRALELFSEAMDLYLSKHEEKKFHDPLAAVCLLHPDVGTWYSGGELYRHKDGWGTRSGGSDNMLIDVNYPEFWQHIFKGE